MSDMLDMPDDMRSPEMSFSNEETLANLRDSDHKWAPENLLKQATKFLDLVVKFTSAEKMNIDKARECALIAAVVVWRKATINRQRVDDECARALEVVRTVANVDDVVLGNLVLLLRQAFELPKPPMDYMAIVQEGLQLFTACALPLSEDRDTTLDLLSRKNVEVGDDGGPFFRFASLMELLRTVYFRANETTAAVSEPFFSSTDVDDLKRLFEESGVLTKLSAALMAETKCAARRGRIYGLLAVWVYNNSAAALPDVIYHCVLELLGSEQVDSRELGYVASLLGNIAYRSPSAQDQFQRDGVSARLVHHAEKSANNFRSVIRILVAYRNINHPWCHPDEVRRIVASAFSLCEEDQHVTELSAIAAGMLRQIADPDDVQRLIETLAKQCYKVLADLGQQVLERRGIVVDNQDGRWKMSWDKRSGDRVASLTFNAALVSAPCRDFWTSMYWVGLPECGVPCDLLDELCLCGLSPSEAVRVLRDDDLRDIVCLGGVARFVIDRYGLRLADLVRTDGHTDWLECSARHALRSWLYDRRRARSDFSDEDILNWFSTYVGTAYGVRIYRGGRDDVVAEIDRARSSGPYGGFCHYNMENVGLKTLLVAAHNSPGNDSDAVGRLLCQAGVPPLEPGRKRWFHGGPGSRAKDILCNESIMGCLRKELHDLSPGSAFYLHETFARAAQHARKYAVRHVGAAAESMTPAVLIVDLPEELVPCNGARRLILADQRQARRHIWLCRHAVLPEAYVNDDEAQQRLAAEFQMPPTTIKQLRYKLPQVMRERRRSLENVAWVFGYMAATRIDSLEDMTFWREDPRYTPPEHTHTDAMFLGLDLPMEQRWAHTKLTEMVDGFEPLGQLALTNIDRDVTFEVDGADEPLTADDLVMRGLRAVVFLDNR